jgi:hypothetical protein
MHLDQESSEDTSAADCNLHVQVYALQPISTNFSVTIIVSVLWTLYAHWVL